MLKSIGYQLATLLLLTLLSVSCSRAPVEQPPAPQEPSTPPPVVLATPTPEPEEPAFEHDTSSQVSILGYHRFEDRPRDPLAISPSEFRAQLQRLKDENIPVISMQEFLAWRNGEINIPPRAVVITIDDGYDCTYEIANPILQEFEYPFTAFVYLDYIEAGGRSITWSELQQIVESGGTIGSHSLSHASLSKRKGRSDEEFDEFLRLEMGQSKKLLEEQLGVTVNTLAYPYGQYGEEARRVGKELGYEALFTVNGQTSDFETPSDAIGRFVIQSGMPEIFENAIRFQNYSAGMDAYAQAAEPPANGGTSSPAPKLPVLPENGGVINDQRPTLQVDFSELNDIDPTSLSMSLSGFGQLPVAWDAGQSIATAKIPESLREKKYTAKASAHHAEGKKVIAWTFEYLRETNDSVNKPD